ncbi:energy-coupling factor transporter transmembrane protein EcfT [Shewanella mesophila]|nr:energy-coupling factor transporter transmembrane protein EcfT [Shewanella mesophila]
MLFCLSLSSCAFFLATKLLPSIILINTVLLIHGYFMGGKFRGLLLLFSTQLVFTVSLYLLLHDVGRVSEGAMAVVRILLAIVPGWWLSMTCAPHRIGEVLSWFLPHKWAFVMAASFSLLPYMSRELKEIYQMQVMRGARITPKDLCRPTNWSELIYCVLYPLLILLLKLSKQMALAAQLRRFGQHKKPTHWPD